MPGPKQRLSSRLFGAFFALSLVILLASAAAVVALSWIIYEGDAEESLSSQAETVALRLAGMSEDRMTRELEDLLLGEVRITLIAGNGDILFDSFADESAMENHADREEVLAALGGGSAVTLRRSGTTGEDTLYAATAVADSGCVLRLAEARFSLPYYLGNMLFPLAIIVVLAVAFSVFLARFMARRIAAPLIDIDLEDPLSNSAYVEIEPLLARVDAQHGELLAKNKQLEYAVQMRREFTGNVSHEMKSPLQVIGGYAELIESGIAEGDDAKRFAGIIRSEASSMRDLIDDVLTLSKLDEAAQLGETIFDFSEVCRRAVERRGVEVLVEVPCAALAKGSESLAEQMVYNLVDNAARHGSGEGVIELLLEPDGSNWRLTVSDDGPGIPVQLRERVFERFYRVDSSRSRDTGGTGLGLAIVKHAAEAMGGRAAIIEPRLGGTTVEVVFPACMG